MSTDSLPSLASPLVEAPAPSPTTQSSTPGLPPPATPEEQAQAQKEKEEKAEQDKIAAQSVSLLRQAANACSKKEFTKARTLVQEATSLLGVELPTTEDEDESAETAQARKMGTLSYMESSSARRSALPSAGVQAAPSIPTEKVAGLPPGAGRYDQLT